MKLRFFPWMIVLLLWSQPLCWALPPLPRLLGAFGADSEVTLEQYTLDIGGEKRSTFLLDRTSNFLHRGAIWHPNFLRYDMTLTQRSSSLRQEEYQTSHKGWDFDLSSELLQRIAPLRLYGRRSTTTTEDEGRGLDPGASYGSVGTAYGFDWFLPFPSMPLLYYWWPNLKPSQWPNLKLSLDKRSVTHDDPERADENEWSTLFDLKLDKTYRRPHGLAHLQGEYNYESTTMEADLNSISRHELFLEGDTPLSEKAHLRGQGGTCGAIPTSLPP